MPINTIDIANTGLSLYNLLPTAALTIVVSIIISLIERYLKSRPNRRKTNIWIKFLKNDKYIFECINKYHDIESLPKIKSMIIAMLMGYSLGIFGGFALTYLSVMVFQKFNISVEFWVPDYGILINFLIVFSVLLYIRYYMDNKDNEKILNNSERILILITFVNFVILSSFLLTIGYLAIFLPIYSSSGISIFILLSTGITSIALVVATFGSYKIRRDLLDDVKDLLNKQYSKKYVETFPKVSIKTNSMTLEGKICDIFNDDMITLDDFGVKKAVEWDSIKYIELKKFCTSG